jgi:HK97 family phage portal protein
MAWYNKLFGNMFKRSAIIPTNYTGDNWDVINSMAYTTNSGLSVSEFNAMENTAVSAAVRIISESVGSLPLPLYQQKKDGSKEKAIQHPLYYILNTAPNPYMTAMTFKELMTSYMLLWGNAYAEIDWGPDGTVRGLYPLRPDMTFPLVLNGLNEIYQNYPMVAPGTEGIVYRTIINGTESYLPAYRVLHIPGLGFDGLRGHSLIQLHRDAVGLAKATEKYGNKYFGNGAKPGGVLEHPGSLSKPAQDNLRSSWNLMHSGLDNAHRIAILEEGMTYKQIGLPPEDSQFLETRKFQVAEIARIFRVPLHMLAELDRSTNNNIEHQGIEFVVHTLRSWLTRWEQSIGKSLLSISEQKKYFAEYQIDALLRGDVKSRYEAYQIARQNGWMSANDIRKAENMNPISKDDGGDAYLVNGAMIAINQATAIPQPNQKGGGDPNGQGITDPNNQGGAPNE